MHYIQRCLFSTKHVEKNHSHADMTPHSLADFQIQNLSIFLEVFLWYVVAARCSSRATAFHQQHVFVLLTCRPCAGVCSVGSRGNMGLRMMRACMLQVQRSSISAHANQIVWGGFRCETTISGQHAPESICRYLKLFAAVLQPSHLYDLAVVAAVWSVTAKNVNVMK